MKGILCVRMFVCERACVCVKDWMRLIVGEGLCE